MTQALGDTTARADVEWANLDRKNPISIPKLQAPGDPAKLQSPGEPRIRLVRTLQTSSLAPEAEVIELVVSEYKNRPSPTVKYPQIFGRNSVMA